MNSFKELGEREIIELILKNLNAMPNMPIPLGDDVSAVDIGRGKLAVLKTDMLVGKTDVPKGMSLWQAARKAVVMNISDFAAKGVKPTAMLVSLGIPRGFEAKDIEEIGRGLNAGAREYNTYIIGGDTNESTDLIISCTMFGVAKKRFLMTRFGAKPKDILAVTGTFGKTSCGLKILLEKLSVPPRIRRTFVNSVLLPQARLSEGLALANSRAVTASIDSSDGLAWSLHEIARASKVGFLVNQLPASNETREFAKIHSLDFTELVLYGGEEYELVVTVKPRLWKKAKLAVEQAGGVLIKIGKAIQEKGKILLNLEGKKVPIELRGWEHFKTKTS